MIIAPDINSLDNARPDADKCRPATGAATKEDRQSTNGLLDALFGGVLSPVPIQVTVKAPACPPARQRPINDEACEIASVCLQSFLRDCFRSWVANNGQIPFDIKLSTLNTIPETSCNVVRLAGFFNSVFAWASLESEQTITEINFMFTRSARHVEVECQFLSQRNDGFTLGETMKHSDHLATACADIQPERDRLLSALEGFPGSRWKNMGRNAKSVTLRIPINASVVPACPTRHEERLLRTAPQYRKDPTSNPFPLSEAQGG